MNDMRRIILIIYILILLFCLCSCKIVWNSLELKYKWEVSLPEPDNMNSIFMTDGFQDGFYFRIWEYDAPIELPEEFHIITQDNIVYARSLYDRFLDELATLSYMHEYALVQKNFSKDSICDGNYYFKRTDKDNENHRIYMFYDSIDHCVYELVVF